MSTFQAEDTADTMLRGQEAGGTFPGTERTTLKVSGHSRGHMREVSMT